MGQAGLVLWIWIRSDRLQLEEGPGFHGLGKGSAHFGIADARAGVDFHRRHDPGGEAILRVGDPGNDAGGRVAGERQNQAAAGSQPLDPERMRMGHAGIDGDRVAFTGIGRYAVSRVHGNVRVIRKVLSSPGCQARIDFAGRYPPAWPNHFGHDRSVIADPATQVVNAVAGVGLRGLGDATGYATGTINMPDMNSVPAGGVPEGAQVVEAYLYWQTVESSQTAFAGQHEFFRPVFPGGPSSGYAISGTVLGDQAGVWGTK